MTALQEVHYQGIVMRRVKPRRPSSECAPNQHWRLAAFRAVMVLSNGSRPQWQRLVMHAGTTTASLPLNGRILPLGPTDRAGGWGGGGAALYCPRISTLGFAMSLLLRTSLLLVLGVLPFAVPAAKDQSATADQGRKVSVSQEGQDVVHFCAELEDARFVGSNNRIEVDGPCNSVSIVGTGNTASVLGLATQISVDGNDNKVSWAAGDRPKPTTTINGRGNVVERQKTE